MDYEIAKKLKEKGFPQNFKNDFYTKEGLIFRQPTSRPMIGDEIFIPTLSELIGACGDDFLDLVKCPAEILNLKINWAARKDATTYGLGRTPEEAVSHLWLQINNK